MKQCFILVIMMLFVNSLFAQSSKIHTSLHARLLNSLLQEQSSQKAAERSTAGISLQRVIAQSTRDNTLVIFTDSVHVKYSLSRGSAYDYSTMLYPYNYPYSASPMFNYAGTFTKPQVLFDTFRHWQVDPNTLVYGYYETAYAGYDTHNNTTAYADIFVDSAINPNMLYANTFNAANNITSGYWFNWVLGVPDSAFKQFFSYNAANKLIKDSTYEYHLGSWRLASKTFYTYDVSNNLIQIDNYANTTDTSFTLPLIEQQKYVNTYDASGRLLTVLDSTYDGTALDQYVKDTFAYSGVYAYHNSWKEYQYDPINHYWAPMFYMTKVINGSGLPDTVLIKSFDSLLNAWVPQTMDVISYNSFHNPDTLQDYEYNFTAYPPTPSFTTVYYYETYINTLGVNNVALTPDNTKIFPNPTTNTITISQVDVPKNSVVTVSLLNVNGQMVSRQYMQWQDEAQISVSDLTPGVYWVVIQDESGNMVHRQAFVKQ
jgi:hypothetical protein